MKSKTSFFNPAVFKKNMSLFWPIWVCYLLFGLIKVPGLLWFRLQQAKKLTETVCFTAVGTSLRLEADIIAIAIMSVVCGMALFGYLFTQKSAYTIHALPVTRKELYFTNIISGLGFMFVPQFLVFLVTVLLCIGKGISCFEFLGMWLLSVMGIAFFMFSVVCFCVMLTGQLFALPVYFAAMNFAAYGISLVIRLVAGVLGFGLSIGDIRNPKALQILAPMNYIFDNVRIGSTASYSNKMAVSMKLTYCGGRVVLCYVLVAAAVFTLAYYCYRKRRIESAGDFLTFNWMKPVFRWAIGIGIGYTAGVLAARFLNIVLHPIKPPTMLISVLLFGCLGFFIAQMFIEKGFRVFRKKLVKECLIFLVFTACSFGAMSASARHLEQYIPREENVSRAYIGMNYPVEYKGEKISDAIAIHREILALADQCRNRDSYQNMYVSVDYHLKNGREVTRSYSIPQEVTESEGLSRHIRQQEESYDSFMSYLVGYDFQTISVFSGGTFETDHSDWQYRTVDLDEQTAKCLYQALQEDVKAGVVQKYNLSDSNADKDGGSSLEMAGFSIDFMHQSADWQDVYQRMNGEHNRLDGDVDANMYKSGSLYVSFGPDCEHIIETLVDCGVVKSPSDIHYSVMGETQ